MKRKGYVYSMLVFLIFIAVFLLVITNLKSVSVVERSAYGSMEIMKISEFARNVEEVWPSFKSALPLQARCSQFGNRIDGEFPFETSVTCDQPASRYLLELSSHSGNYNITMNLASI